LKRISYYEGKITFRHSEVAPSIGFTIWGYNKSKQGKKQIRGRILFLHGHYKKVMPYKNQFASKKNI